MKKYQAAACGRLCTAAAAALAVWALGAGSAQALEVTGGDYEQVPGGLNLGMLYLQHAERSALYVQGRKVLGDFNLKSDIGLLRYIRTVQLDATTTVDPQVILPFGKLSTSGSAAMLGNAEGVADLIVGAPVKFLLNPTSKDAFSVGPYLYLPTGSYDRNKPLNLGEHRWKGLLQLAWVTHFNPQWALDVVGDVMVHGKNRQAGPGTADVTLKQDPRYELQGHLRYIVSPATALSFGYGLVTGAATTVNGAGMGDRQRTQYARLTAAHFIDQTTQLQAQLGSDVKVENGAREKARLNLRLVKIF